MARLSGEAVGIVVGHTCAFDAECVEATLADALTHVVVGDAGGQVFHSGSLFDDEVEVEGSSLDVNRFGCDLCTHGHAEDGACR